jgi:uncharacterized protein
MANPSTAHEPSMEEILASIRQIISEDGEGSTTPKAGSARTEAPAAPAVEESGPASFESVVSSFEPEPSPPMERRQAGQEIARSPAAWEADPASEDFEAKIHPHFPASGVEEDESRLLSPEKGAAVAGSFGALAESMLAQHTRTLEEVVSDMLQPMLKSWLDNNLPSLVERMVKEEIERVSRGRR